MSSEIDLDPKEQQLEKFLSDLASSKPAPGGGSAAAVAGALAAALSSMVANLTVDKEDYVDVSEKFERVLDRTDELRYEFLEAINEDIAAYTKVMDAYKAPTETEEQKRGRRQAIQDALKGATEPPFKMAELAIEVLKLSKECAVAGNTHAVSDAGASAILAEATVRTALLNVDINLSSISDEDFVAENTEKRERLTRQARESSEEVVGIMSEKI